RNRLLAEHLATTPRQVQAELDRGGGMHAAIATLGRSARRLSELEPEVARHRETLFPEQAMLDSEGPIDAQELFSNIVPHEARKPAPRRLVGLGLLALALAALAVAWRWTPLRDYINLGSLVALARGLESMPFTPLAVVASYVVA